MSGLQWICLLVVFIGMLFGEGLLGFGVGGQFFGLDFNLETSTPEFPQKGVGDAFGLLSGLFYGLSMFFNGYRKDADTTARGVWNFIFAVLGAGLITIILNSLGSQPGMENWALSVHFTTFNWIGAVLLWIICGLSLWASSWWPAATCRLLTTAPSPTGRCPWPSSWVWSSSARR